MSGDNGQEEARTKKCPMLNDWCIGDACAMRPEMMRAVGGIPQKFTVCWVDAIVILLSEIYQKTQAPPPQPIKLPGGLFRG